MDEEGVSTAVANGMRERQKLVIMQMCNSLQSRVPNSTNQLWPSRPAGGDYASQNQSQAKLLRVHGGVCVMSIVVNSNGMYWWVFLLKWKFWKRLGHPNKTKKAHEKFK